MLNEAQVAELLGVPAATVAAWRHLRIGPPAVKVGPGHLYSRSMVATWLRRGAYLEHGISLLLTPGPADHLEEALLVECPVERRIAGGV